MARSFEFSVLRLCPDAARGETVNLGIVVFHERGADIRIGEVISRARALYPHLSAEKLRDGVSQLQRYCSVDLSAQDRWRSLNHFGLFKLGEIGSFTVDDDNDQAYQAKVDQILRHFTSSITRTSARGKAPSRLNTTVRKILRSEKVLAPIGDAGAISEHKIVPEWPIPKRPNLKVDLALRNRIMRVCEIAELNIGDDGMPPASLFEKVVTLDLARRDAGAQQKIFAYRAIGPTARVDEALSIALVHADRLVNWDVPAERDAFLHEWIAAARDTSVEEPVNQRRLALN